MRFKIINGHTLQILREKLPFKFRTHNGMIVLYNGEICYFNEYNYQLVSLDNLEETLKNKSEENWRDSRYKTKYFEYFNMVLREMKSIKRDFTIDNILNKNEFDPIILAC